jgi:hypothetical protein
MVMDKLNTIKNALGKQEYEKRLKEMDMSSPL